MEVEITLPPYSLNQSGKSVPPPKNETLYGVFVIIMKNILSST
jgi:hypothetical protein